MGVAVGNLLSEPLMVSAGGFPYNNVHIEYWKERALKAEAAGNQMRAALEAIKKATVDGRVCDDVAWFDDITTLYDFCDLALHSGFGHEQIKEPAK